MAYNLRERKQKDVYVESNSDSDTDSDDPDYARIQPKRQQTRGPVKSPYAHPKRGQGVQMSNFSGTAGSSRDMVGIRGRVKKRFGLRCRNAVAPIQDNIRQVERVGRGKVTAPRSKLRTRRSFPSFSVPSNNDEKRTILALLIDMSIVKIYEEVYCCNWAGNTSTLRGQITRRGIYCNCCNEVVTVSDFQLHAWGDDKRGMPYNNIVAANSKLSLMQCQGVAWNRGKEFGSSLMEYSYNTKNEDKSDDACIICADGGDLICCSECPLTYHIDCLDMKNVPESNWVCPCCLCKHCGGPGTKYKNITDCKLCGKQYHLECHGNPRVEVSRLCSTFCGKACHNIDMKLKDIIGAKNKLDGRFSWTLLHHFKLWKYLKPREEYARTECNSKLTIAWEMMNQCFEPVIDRLTGVNILKNVVYNTSSTLTRIDFKRFYTAVLEKGDEIVATACIRLHGKRMAEMPFVATHESCRNQGMLTKLMTSIETALRNMEIEHLIIPAAQDAQNMWIEKFNFSPIPTGMKRDIMLSKLLMFPDSVRLQKPLTDVAAEPSRRLLPFDLNFEPPEEDDGEMRSQP